ncbi:conserved protein [Tepidicaulis marinus]|uniref:Conserved protein n=1 Tax=Tepidicaulis marinus TaxID=1333998 RepID=A0A081BDU6_9HYPH|nr:DUF1365 domain-containing protein [Tepidicaulis marinus]GAK46214.1 conserved protein [Tepidicaulis marinus]
MSEAFSSALYDAAVMHRRFVPRAHGFSYKVFYGLFDLDELPRLDKALRFFSLGKRNLFSFYPQDHGNGRDTDLRGWAESVLRGCGQSEAPARILLLAHPRMLGFAFNPLSIFYCFDGAGRLTALLYQVTNTFGERHVYPCLVEEGGTPQAVTHETGKLLYVSPFNPARGHYRLKLSQPGEKLFVHIRYHLDGALTLVAGLQGRQAALSDAALLKRFLRFPFMTFKVVAGIHFEALRLWLKKVPLWTRPSAPRAFPSQGLSSVTVHSDTQR